ncbi:MAG TPA: YhcH/YjgK/YiaL family protein [Mucilaginibacter sp.]
MKKRSAYSSLWILTALLFVSSIALSQTTPTKWTKKEADKWVKSKVWAPNLKPDADASVNSVEFATQYAANKEGWDKAFAFLASPDLPNLKPGRVNIDGVDGDNVYALVMNDVPKDIDKTNYEVHKKYVDLHYVVEGKEKINYTLFTNIKNVVTPFDDAKDIGYYTYDKEDYNLTATPDKFFLFFPAQAHRAHMKVNGETDKIKKVVVKVRYINQ